MAGERRPRREIRTEITRAAVVAASIATAACSGGGGSPPSTPRSIGASPSPGVPSSLPQATFQFVWPAQPVSGTALRRPAYVSPSIASLTISIDGATPITENAPKPTGSPQTVSYTIGIGVGTHSLTIAEYDAANKLLGRATEPITIVEDVDNVIGFTLDGNLAQIAIVQTIDPFLEGTLATGFTLVGDRAQTFEAIPEDADGNRIINPGAIPVISTTSASPKAIVDTDIGNDRFTLYAPIPTAFETVTASGRNLDGATVTATFKVDALAALYVANYTRQTIGVFDENGVGLDLPPAAFIGLENPGGLAYIPSSIAGLAGTLIVTQTADSSVPAVTKFDTAGNPLSLASQAFGGTAEPLYPGYGVVGNTPTLAVPDENDNSIQLFDLSGNALPLAKGAFPKLDVPDQILYDAHDGDYYVTNLGSATINKYSSTGAAIGSGVSAGYDTMGETLDASSHQLFVVYQAQALPVEPIDGKPVSLGPQIAHVMVFDETPAAVTEPATAFLPPSTTAFYADILLDPYTKQLFVTDAGDDKMVAFTEAGATVNLASGAFANLSDPLGMAIVP